MRILDNIRDLMDRADASSSPEREAQDAALARACLRALPTPEGREVERVRRRARATLAAPEPSRLPLLWGPALAGALGLALWMGWSAMQAPPPATALDLAIEPGAAEDPLQIAPDVKMVAHGRGQIYGTSRSPRLHWVEGKVDLDITPNMGVDLVVNTDEGTARVVGTAFSLERTAFGTVVTVNHGRVAVDCAAGPSALLTEGTSLECVPTRPSALLGRARAQIQRGDAAAEVIRTLDLATRSDNPEALAGEVLATRATVLYDAGRVDEALTDAQHYLAAGHSPRRAEMRVLATSVLLTEGGCAAAMELLQQAASEGASPDEQAALAACEAQR